MPIEPSPKPNAPKTEEKSNWSATSILDDVQYEVTSDKSFDEVLEERRIKRIVTPVQLRITLAFVKQVFTPRQLGKRKLSGLARKTMISAGALHPIDVVIVDGPGIEDPVLFADRSADLLTLPILDRPKFDKSISDAKLILPSANGHMLLFTADRRRASNVYNVPDSLLWRDAGAALQVCSMAAYAYELAFCPLGYTGSAILSALGAPHEDFLAVGLGILGH